MAYDAKFSAKFTNATFLEPGNDRKNNAISYWRLGFGKTWLAACRITIRLSGDFFRKWGIVPGPSRKWFEQRPVDEEQ
jgi:hypothetical protein